VDWQVTQVQTGEMHGQGKNGIVHDFFPELKGSAAFSPHGGGLCFLRVRQRLWSKFLPLRRPPSL
jgi:hypothetical protein